MLCDCEASPEMVKKFELPIVKGQRNIVYQCPVCKDIQLKKVNG